MNMDSMLKQLFDVMDEAMAKCHRCQTGIDHTAKSIRVLADEKAGRMPDTDKNTYIRAALSQIASAPIDE